MIKRISWLAACSSLTIVMGPVQASPTANRNLDEAIQLVRDSLHADEPIGPPPTELTGDDAQLAQWGNWANWPNWANWGN